MKLMMQYPYPYHFSKSHKYLYVKQEPVAFRAWILCDTAWKIAAPLTNNEKSLLYLLEFQVFFLLRVSEIRSMDGGEIWKIEDGFQ